MGCWPATGMRTTPITSGLSIITSVAWRTGPTVKRTALMLALPISALASWPSTHHSCGRKEGPTTALPLSAWLGSQRLSRASQPPTSACGWLMTSSMGLSCNTLAPGWPTSTRTRLR
ncbi:hypothetical protein D3C81_1691200 [compost metagenome]